MKTISAHAITSILKSNGLPFKDHMSKVIGPLIAKHQPEYRVRTYPPEVVVYGMVYQALDSQGSLKKAVVRNNADRISKGLAPASVNTASYSDARSKLNVNVLREGAIGMALNAEQYVPNQWQWNGYQLKAIDGTTFTANDTPENQSMYPQHGKQAIGVGFPILRAVVLQSLSTGMILNTNFGCYKGKETGEMALARPLLSNLTKGDLLLGDRYYPSFFLMAELLKLGVEGVFQSHGARDIDFRTGESSGILDHIVEWERPKRPSWMTAQEYQAYPESIKIRELDATDAVSSKDRFVIATTLLDSSKFSKDDLASLFKKRWNIELALRDIKETMNFDHIDANTPMMIEKEIWAHMLAYNVLRWHIANAAAIGERTIDSISVATAKKVLIENRSNILAARDIHTLRGYIFLQILQCRVGNRPGRAEPRAVKHRPKPRDRLNESRRDWKNRRAA